MTAMIIIDGKRKLPGGVEEGLGGPLYKFCTKEEYATGFVEGRMRITTYITCRLGKGEQGDGHEGQLIHNIDHLLVNSFDPVSVRALEQTGILRAPPEALGVRVSHTTLVGGVSDALMLCLTEEPDVGVMGKGLGNFRISIPDPIRLFEVLTASIDQEFRLRGALFARVRYGSRVVTNREINDQPTAFLKPPSYKHQREIRMAWAVVNQGMPLRPQVLDFPAAAGLSFIS